MSQFDRHSRNRVRADGPIRIGQFTDSFPPIINGVSAFISEHHKQLLEQGCKAYIFTFGYAKYRGTGVVRSPGVPYGRSEFRTNLFLNPRATKLANSLDVYHIHEPFGIGGVALRIAKQRKRPIVFTNHTQHDVYIENYPRIFQPTLQLHVSKTMATFLRASSISTTPSEYSARWLRSLAPDVADRVQVVHNGIDLSVFDHADQRASREELGIPADSTIFIYVGRLTPEKNLPAFANAFREAVMSGANAHWVVIGEGRIRTALEDQLISVCDRVHFLGTLPREKIPAYLSMADVFATTSLSEVNPLSVIEAMAAGKPFLGLEAGWWEEFSDRHTAGVLTDHHRPSLVAAIKRLCDDRNGRLQMGLQARRISRAFDIRTVTSKWLDIYHSVVDRQTAALVG